MIIRPAISSEVRTIAAIGVIAWEQAFEAAGENLGGLYENAEATYFYFCERYWPIIIVIEHDREIVAWGALETGESRMSDLWVLPNFQRKGIGNALLGALETQAQESGHDMVELETHSKNAPAISFFQKNGYTVSGLKSAYSQVLDKSVDTLEMRKRFN